MLNMIDQNVKLSCQDTVKKMPQQVCSNLFVTLTGSKPRCLFLG